MCHGSGEITSLFLLVILRVATVEVHGCRTGIASAPTTAGLLIACRGAERALVEAQNCKDNTSKDPFSQCELYKEFAYKSKLSKWLQRQQLN